MVQQDLYTRSCHKGNATLINAANDNNNGNDDNNDGNNYSHDDDEDSVTRASMGGEQNESNVDGECVGFSLGSKILWHWEHRKVKIEHAYAITGWALCIMIEVHEDVRNRLNGEHRTAMEKVIKLLHLSPCCPNQHPEVLKMSESEIVIAIS